MSSRCHCAGDIIARSIVTAMKPHGGRLSGLIRPSQPVCSGSRRVHCRQTGHRALMQKIPGPRTRRSANITGDESQLALAFLHRIRDNDEMARRAKSTRQLTGLYHAREARGMSRSELVERSGVSKQQLSRLENGQIRLRLDHLKPFASVLGYTPEQILLWGRFPGTGAIEAGGKLQPVSHEPGEVPELDMQAPRGHQTPSTHGRKLVFSAKLCDRATTRICGKASRA